MSTSDLSSLNIRLLEQVLKAAEARGIGQEKLAAEAGITPETLSRAKRRGDIKLSTITKLSSIVGLRVSLLPETKITVGKKISVIKHQKKRVPLAQPKFGLAWSNPNAKEDVLLRNALLQGRFNAILESAAQDGVPFVRDQFKQLCDRGALNDNVISKLDRMIKSIERGFAEAQLGHSHAS